MQLTGVSTLPLMTSTTSPFETIQYDEARRVVVLLDQTLLPLEERYIDIPTAPAMWEAIRSLRVRGAPAIGIAGAYGLYLGMLTITEAMEPDAATFSEALAKEKEYLDSARPTAVNLRWALERCHSVALRALQGGGVKAAMAALLSEARTIHAEDAEVCRLIGEHGQALLANGQTVLTHCNAGGLATARYGTALSVILAARQHGKAVAVFADETRPLLQGARLTTWELMKAGVPVTLICDNMAASVMAQGRVQAVIVGTDRVAANGDFANKIGTYGVALAAHAHKIPFYVAAPLSSIDMQIPSGDHIPIEERSPEEITLGLGRQIAPTGVKVYNPAFDVTPAALVTAFITEKGILRPPFTESLRRAFEGTREA